MNFGPRTDQEIGLLKHMKKNQDHVSYESVCSGLGIPSIYKYLLATSVKNEESAISNELGNDDDLTRAIIDIAGQKRRKWRNRKRGTSAICFYSGSRSRKPRTEDHGYRRPFSCRGNTATNNSLPEFPGLPQLLFR